MANRYWVGGSGTWGSTTKWSATSGGASGASVPTAADTAIFDANSDAGLGAITVTLAANGVTGPLILTDLDQNLTFTGAFSLSVAGNFTMPTNNGLTVSVTGLSSSRLTLNSSAQRAVTGNGSTLTGGIILNSADGITLQDNFTITGAFTHTAGNVTLNGKTLSIGSMVSSGSGIRVLAFTVAGSKIAVTGTDTAPWNVSSGTNYSITTQANARVEFTNSSASTRTISHTVGATAAAVSFYILSGGDTVNIGTSAFVRNLDFTGFSGTWGATAFTLCGDLTVSTGMTCASGTTVVTFVNATATQTQTITSNGKQLNRRGTFTALSTNGTLTFADNCNFNEIFTFNLGTLNLNNLTLKCTNWASSSATNRIIAFETTGKIECIGTSSAFVMTDVTGFSYTGTSYILLSADTGVGVAKAITVSSSATYAQSMNFYITNGVGGSLVTPSIGCVFRTLNMSGTDASLNTNAITMYGDLIMGLFGGIVASSNAITFAGTNTQGADGDGIMDFYTGPNVNCNRPVTKTGTSTLRLTSDLVMGTTLARTFTLTQGTLDLQSYDMYIWGTFNSSGSTARTLTHDGSGKIYLTSSNVSTGVEMSTTTNLTVTAGLTFVAALIGATARTGTFNFGTLSEATAPNFTIDMTPTTSSTQTCTGNVNNVAILDNANANFALGAGGMTVYGNFSVGASPIFITTAGTLTFGKTSGTQTLTTSGKVFGGAVVKTGAGTLQLLDAWTMGTSGTTTSFTLTQGTLDINRKTFTLHNTFNTNNSNVRSIINTAGNDGGSNGKILLLSPAAGGTPFNAVTSTNMSTDGNVLVELQGAGTQTLTPGTISEADKPLSFFINKSGGTATFSVSNNVGSLTVNSAVSTTTTLNLYGNLVMQSGGSISGSLDFEKTSGTQTITSATKTLNNITKNGAGTLQLLDNLTIAAATTFAFNQGTLDISTRTLTVPGNMLCTVGTSNSATLSFSAAGKIVLSGSGNVWEVSLGAGASFTTTGDNLGVIDLTSASAKNFIGGNGSYPTIKQGGSGALTILGEGTYYDITNSVQPATVIFESAKTNTFTNDFNLSGTSGNLITIESTVAGSQHTLSKASGTVSVSHCSIKDSNATGGATWESYTSNGNVDAGNNTGWIFSSSTYPGYIGMMIFY